MDAPLIRVETDEGYVLARIAEAENPACSNVGAGSTAFLLRGISLPFFFCGCIYMTS